MVVPTDQRSLSTRRADATREAIVETAWRLSANDGLTGWSLRQLAKEIGLAAPTLYAYFDDKHAIYDAMFKDGYTQALEAATPSPGDGPPGSRARFKHVMHLWFAFCTEQPTRYQLLFQRVIPDFVPSDEAYAASVLVLEQLTSLLAAAGVDDPADVDLWTAISTGLTSQQISNDPGGDRWEQLVDTAVDLFCDHVGMPTDPEGASS